MKNFVLALALLAPAAAQAQFGGKLGGSLGVRSATEEETPFADSERRGYEAQLFYDRAVTPALSWRLTLGGAQLQYQRNQPSGGPLAVSESSVELGVLGRAFARDGALSGLYAVAGPVASFRLSCGVSGAFIACGSTADRGVGYTLGAGFVSAISERRNVVFEVRYADGVVGSGGSPVLNLAIGLQNR